MSDKFPDTFCSVIPVVNINRPVQHTPEQIQLENAQAVSKYRSISAACHPAASSPHLCSRAFRQPSAVLIPAGCPAVSSAFSLPFRRACRFASSDSCLTLRNLPEQKKACNDKKYRNGQIRQPAAYDKAPPAVTCIKNLNHMTGCH